MASKIQSHNFYVAITPYKVEDSSADEFNELNVRTAYDDCRKYFYVTLHAGWDTGWGGHGCILMGADDPLTGPKYVKVKDSPKNSQKTINEMGENLEQAKDAIAWLFDHREWAKLYMAVGNIARNGYTEGYRKQIETLINSNNNQNKEDKTMKLNLSNNKKNETKNAAEQQVNNNEPIVRQVDVMGLMGALNRDGHAKLSDHVIEDAEAVEVNDKQAEEIQSVNVGEVTLATIMPKMTAEPEAPTKPTESKPVKAAIKREQSGAGSNYAEREQARSESNTGRTKIVVAGVPKPTTNKTDETDAAPKAETKAARYQVQLLPAKSGGVWPKLYGFRDEKSAKAVAEKMPSSVTARWDYGMNGEGRETKTRYWHLKAGKRYCGVMQELADALNKGDRVAVANAAAKACGVYAGVVAENKSKSDAEPKPKREKKQEPKAKAETKTEAAPAMSSDDQAMFELFKRFMAGDKAAMDIVNNAMSKAA